MPTKLSITDRDPRWSRKRGWCLWHKRRPRSNCSFGRHGCWRAKHARTDRRRDAAVSDLVPEWYAKSSTVRDSCRTGALHLKRRDAEFEQKMAEVVRASGGSGLKKPAALSRCRLFGPHRDQVDPR
jgi:hypothetical protein